MLRPYVIYYSIDDAFPPYRVDVAELFGRELHARNVEVIWYMRRGQSTPAGQNLLDGQTVRLPPEMPGSGLLAKVFNKLAFWAFDLFYLLLLLGRKVDVIQVRDKYFAAFAALLVARLKGARFVYWCSYPFPEHYLERARMSGGFRKLYAYLHGHLGQWILYRVVIPYSDHSFVQSDRMLSDIAAFGVPTGKMTPVPMGVSTRMLQWARIHRAAVVPLSVVYLGTLAAVRRMDMLIDAFSEVLESQPGAQLTLVGEGDSPHERAALEEQVKRLGISKSVTFTGFIPMDQAWSIAARAAVCVSPFLPNAVLASASPTKLVEYMALGRPVVCNDHPEQSQVIRESGAGLCVAWGASEFARAIAWMLKHPEEAERMGANGPAWVERCRTYPAISERVLRQYERIIEGAA